jgi:signal transduction histidine kinase/HD-like signal output (HDOD) protein
VDNSRRIQQLIERIDKMPSLPTVATRILEVVQDGKSAARDLAEVISKDQGFTAKILKLINSAYYSFPYKVATVSHAVALLGFQTIRSLALGLSIFSLLQGKGEDQPLDREKLWEHSLASAIWARLLAGRISQLVPEEAFVAGLLHDMGKVLFNEHFRRKFAEALSVAAKKNILPRQAEEQVLGLDHTAAGELWAERWNLPPLICRAIAYHHDPLGLPKSDDLQVKTIVAVVHVADYCAEARGFGYGGDGTISPPSQRIWELLGLTEDACMSLAEEVQQEVQRAKEFFRLVEEGGSSPAALAPRADQAPDPLAGVLTELVDLVGCATDPARLLYRVMNTLLTTLRASGVALALSEESYALNVLKVGEVSGSVEQIARRLLATRSAKGGDEDSKKVGPWNPLIEGDRLIGTLWVGRDTPFTAPEEDFLRGAIREVIRSVNHLLDEGQVQRRSEALTSLIEDSATMTLLRGLDGLYPSLAARGRELGAADAAVLYLFQDGVLTPVAADGVDLSFLPSPMPTHEDGWAGWVLATGEPFTIERAESSKPCLEQDLFMSLGFSSHLILPLELLGTRLGVLSLHSCPPRKWSGIEVGVLSAYTTQAAAAIDNAFLHQNLQHQIEEVKRAQSQLIQSTKLAALGELAANIAHEINNPLTSVLGYAGLLLKSFPADDPRRETLQIIEGEALRTRRIVRDLLDFSRQREPVAESTDLHDAISSVLVLLLQKIRSANVEVVEAFDPGLPPVVADPAQMKQVFLNLIANAIDAMPDGGTLTLTSQVLDTPDGAFLEVAIRDTGCGIIPDQRERIFEPFFTTKPEGQGTGLGLSVSLGIIQAHHGKLLVESEAQTGSTFRVRLPIQSVAQVTG